MRTSDSEEKQIECSDDLTSVGRHAVLDRPELGGGYRRQARHDQHMIDPIHFDDWHQSADDTGNPSTWHERSHDPIGSGIRQIGLQDRDERKRPARTRDGVVYDVILSQAHDASSAAGS